MLPFLMLAIRAEDDAAEGEYAAVLRFSGLTADQLERRRLEQAPLGEVDLAAYSGVILGGGPFNASDPETSKSPTQRRAEGDLAGLLDRIVETDFPFLGACYGIGALGRHQGALVDRTYAEPIGPVSVSLSDAGREDRLLSELPRTFEAFGGHKEAVTELPPHAVHLASSAGCPVQAFRVGSNVYATQFHPELDNDGLVMRIKVYRDHGYYTPDQQDDLLRRARAGVVTHPPAILRRFVELYARPA